MRLSVLVCEDSRAYADALRRMLEHDRDILVHAVCATAQEAIEALPRMEPDLVTWTLELPGMHGLEAVEEIMSSRPLPVLVLSAHLGPAARRPRPRWPPGPSTPWPKRISTSAIPRARWARHSGSGSGRSAGRG